MSATIGPTTASTWLGKPRIVTIFYVLRCRSTRATATGIRETLITLVANLFYSTGLELPRGGTWSR